MLAAAAKGEDMGPDLRLVPSEVLSDGALGCLVQPHRED